MQILNIGARPIERASVPEAELTTNIEGIKPLIGLNLSSSMWVDGNTLIAEHIEELLKSQ